MKIIMKPYDENFFMQIKVILHMMNLQNNVLVYQMNLYVPDFIFFWLICVSSTDQRLPVKESVEANPSLIKNHVTTKNQVHTFRQVYILQRCTEWTLANNKSDKDYNVIDFV